MNDSATSLDRLHDLVPPPEVAWWPPAPGWYVVMAAVGVLLLLLLLHCWRVWQANAYRREALRSLEDADHLGSIAELLRRTALAIAPREEVAQLNGKCWTDWLAARLPAPMPDDVRVQLSVGPYAPRPADIVIQSVKGYAREWIIGHRKSLPPPTPAS